MKDKGLFDIILDALDPDDDLYRKSVCILRRCGKAGVEEY